MKYGNLTLGQIEALLNKVGGEAAVLAVLRGERKLVVEDAQPSAPTTKSALVGKLVKTLILKPSATVPIAEAIALGRYDDFDRNIVQLFADDEVGLPVETGVDLVQFDRDPLIDEVLAWAKANGRQPMLPKHLLAVGAQHRDEQRNAPIVALGSVRGGDVLFLRGSSVWRGLDRGTVEGYWRRRCLFGFLSE